MMLDQLITILTIIVDSFLHAWPYLVLTIPLAVIVNMSGAARYMKRALQTRAIMAIFLAALVGAFSPFCSCGVIPVVAALLMGGVPLAPVMTFWIASPSMDPEIFFLSVATLGWELAVWRLVSTLVLSLTAGFITHVIVRRGWMGDSILRSQQIPAIQSRWELIVPKIRQGWYALRNLLSSSRMQHKFVFVSIIYDAPSTCCVMTENVKESSTPAALPVSGCDMGCQRTSDPGPSECENGCKEQSTSFVQRLSREIRKATVMVVKFMALAYFLKALMIVYVPSEWIPATLGTHNPYAILIAALVGVPVYTSNLTALPMISGLLGQGMNPAAALTFLIAGSTTTLPAMAAVWGITNRRVFVLYASFSLVGSIIVGYMYSFLAGV